MIAVATTKGGLDDNISPVFGRCQTYTIVEVEDDKIKESRVVENPGFTTQGGAGIRAAQFVINQNVEAVIAGNFGPNSSTVLSQSGVKMIQSQGNAKENIMKYVKGELAGLAGPSVEGHYGMRRGGYGRGRGGRLR